MHIPMVFIFAIINFTIFGVVMFLLLRKPIKKFFADRSAMLKESLASAERAETQAAARAKDIQQRMAKIESDIADLKKQSEQMGEEERARVVAHAEKTSEKMKADTTRMIAQELRRVKKSLRGTTVDVAILMAERILQQEITPDDQGRLAKQFVDRLGSVH
jgi:F-type H+-transporting ATPase subunit b